MRPAHAACGVLWPRHARTQCGLTPVPARLRHPKDTPVQGSIRPLRSPRPQPLLPVAAHACAACCRVASVSGPLPGPWGHTADCVLTSSSVLGCLSCQARACSLLPSTLGWTCHLPSVAEVTWCHPGPVSCGAPLPAHCTGCVVLVGHVCVGARRGPSPLCRPLPSALQSQQPSELEGGRGQVSAQPRPRPPPNRTCSVGGSCGIWGRACGGRGRGRARRTCRLCS